MLKMSWFSIKIKKNNNGGNKNNNVVDSNGQGVLDFPKHRVTGKPRVTSVGHSTDDRAKQLAVEHVPTGKRCVPVLSTNTTSLSYSTCDYVDDVDDVECDVAGVWHHDTCEWCDAQIPHPWRSSMDIHGDADRREKANRTDSVAKSFGSQPSF